MPETLLVSIVVVHMASNEPPLQAIYLVTGSPSRSVPSAGWPRLDCWRSIAGASRGSKVPHAFVGIVLVAHGLITTMIGFGSMANPNNATMPAPSWLGWWPGTLGRSWAFDALHLGSGFAVIGGLLWLAAGLALLAAGLGWLGVPVASSQWQMLALVGAVLGLAALALYFHPFYVVAIVIDVVIVASVWGRVVAAR